MSQAASTIEHMFDLEYPPQLSDPELEALTAAEFAKFDDDSERQLIPDDLGEWTPGPSLGAGPAQRRRALSFRHTAWTGHSGPGRYRHRHG